MDSNSMKKLQELMQKQEQLIQNFEDRFQEFKEERAAKKENHHVLKKFEADRRQAWVKINQWHRRLLASPKEWPQTYMQSFDRVSQLNEEFKKALSEVAKEQSLLLNINEEDIKPDNNEEEETIASTSEIPGDAAAQPTVIGEQLMSDEKINAMASDMTKKLTSMNGKSNDDDTKVNMTALHSGMSDNIPTDTTERKGVSNNSDMTGAISSMSSMENSKPDMTKIDGISSNSDMTSASSSMNRTNNMKTDMTGDTTGISSNSDMTTNEASVHGGQPSMNREENKGITDAMSAIVNLVSQQFKYMSETQVSNTILIQEKIQELNKSQGDKDSLKPQKLEIPVFSGQILQYRTFKDLFLKAVSKCNWGKLELMMLLQSKLSGRALERISHLSTDENNYDETWRILDSEFLVVRTLIQHNIQKLVDQPLVKINDVCSMRAFYSNMNNLTNNLKQLRDVDPADWLFEIGYLQLDNKIKMRYEDYLRATDSKASTETITKFLMNECNVIEAQQINNKSNNNNQKEQQHSSTKKQVSRAHTTLQETNTTTSKEADYTCFICKQNHQLIRCPIFLADTNRVELLKHFKICIYCLKHKYNFKRPCNSKDSVICDKCSKNHHTMLHPLSASTTSMLTSHEEQEFQQMANQSTSSYVTKNSETCTILPTAVANVLDKHGLQIPIACLVDSCAERSYISTDTVQKLGLKQYKTSIIIKGLNNITDSAKTYVKLQIQVPDPQIGIINTNAIVVSKIASNIPILNVDMRIFEGKKLANPYVNQAMTVGILLGGDILHQIFISGGRTEIKNGLIMQESILGWIISGRNANPKQIVSTFVTYNESLYKSISDEELNAKLHRFFELPEEVDEVEEENKYCEKLYEEQHYRDKSGRYVVPIPWKIDKPEIGHSYRKSLRFYLWQEKNLEKNPQHKKLSNEFMTEYLQLLHMSEINQEAHGDETGEIYYVPYLSVFRSDSLTTKLRHVFNASAQTSNNLSYNDQVMIGPKCQADIIKILTTARTFKYMVQADIEKCFRQILLKPEDAKRMRIIWRSHPAEDLREFQLDTLVYGVNCSPWLAIRTIQQAAKDHSKSNEVEKIIRNSFFMDDWIYGGDTVSECKRLVNDVDEVMNKAQFKLTKFNANNPEILEKIDENRKITSYVAGNPGSFKTLGLLYHPQEDKLSIKINPIDIDQMKFTKRTVSSIIASYFDPIGFFIPLIVMMRIFLQKMWKLKFDWDEKIPEEMKQEFIKFYKDVCKIAEIRIPRWLSSTKMKKLDLVGFSDASKLSSACVIYSRVKTEEGICTNLVAAKASLNKLQTQAVIESKTETIPKLELKALLMVAELYEQIKSCFEHLQVKFTVYVDSKIVIYWMRDKKVNKNKYVQKKLEKIRKIINPYDVHYICTTQNPSDIPTRPITVEQFINSKLWFNGPEILQNESLPITTDDELNKLSTPESQVLTIGSSAEPEDMFQRFSNLNRLIKSVAYILYWKVYKKTYKEVSKGFSAEEIKTARMTIIRYYQGIYMKDSIMKLEKNQLLPKLNTFRKLSPFLDQNKIVRVGGRLENARFLSNDQIHPIIIPKCHLLTLLLTYIHKGYNHARHSLMQRILVETYYIPAMKSSIHRVISKCPSCIRWTGQPRQPEMSQLPVERVQPGPTFQKVGIDYSGHFFIKSSTLRGAKTIKAYVIVFICLVTKAVHLELCPDMSTETFLNAFSRFCSRRSSPSYILSDNGSNLVGCSKLLREEWRKICKEAQNRLALQEITWKQIPRYAASFGGIYESVMKSLKYFTKRMQEVQNLSYEQFETILLKIEFYLNCRPLYALNHADIGNYCLTPFHFIIMRAGSIHPIELINEKIPLTKKWVQLVSLQKLFWKKFISEYLYTLQKKNKWLRKDKPIQLNDIVLVKMLKESPADYKLAKVIKLYPDHNNDVRKVDIQYGNKTIYQHAVNQLIHLNPAIEESTQQTQQDAENLKKRTDTNTPIPHEPSIKLRLRSAKKQSLVCSALTIFMIVTCATAQISILMPGVHKFEAKSIHMIESYKNIYIHTGVKPYDNQQKLQGHINAFTQDCQNLNSSLQEYCMYWEKLIFAKFQQYKNFLKNRKKRNIGLLLSYGKPLLKYGGYLALGGTMVYQQIEITNLNETIEENQEKLRKSILLINKIADKNLLKKQQMIDDLTEQQLIIIKRDEIRDKGQRLYDLISIMMTNYLETKQKMVNTDIMKHINDTQLSNQLSSLSREDINKISRRTEVILNGEIIIQIEVPLMKTYVLVTIISLPNQNREIISIFGEETPISQLVVDKENNKIARRDHSNEIHTSVFSYLSFISMSACLKNILNKNNTDNCSIVTLPDRVDQIVNLSVQAIVVINEKSNTTIKCKEDVTILPKNYYMVKLAPNCSVTTSSHRFTTNNTVNIYENSSINLTHINIETPKIEIIQRNMSSIDEEIADLMTKLGSTIGNVNKNQACIFIICSIIIIGLCIIDFAFQSLRQEE